MPPQFDLFQRIPVVPHCEIYARRFGYRVVRLTVAPHCTQRWPDERRGGLGGGGSWERCGDVRASRARCPGCLGACYTGFSRLGSVKCVLGGVQHAYRALAGIVTRTSRANEPLQTCRSTYKCWIDGRSPRTLTVGTT